MGLKTMLPNNLDFLMNEASFLVLEDMASFRGQLISDLRILHIKGPVFEAENIKNAKCILEVNKIDFIIADWVLPDGTGLDFLRDIRKEQDHILTPFVICTTKNEIANIINAIDAGASEYISKPWSLEDLKSKIFQSWSKRYGAQK